MRGVARIVNVAVKADQRASSVCEFVQIVLAENHRSGLTQPPNHFRILAWNAILIKSTGRSSTYACGIDQILYSDWNPVQRAAPFSALNFSFGGESLRQR